MIRLFPRLIGRRRYLAGLGSLSLLAGAVALPPSAHAQISLSTAVSLALTNSLKVKVAESDLRHAKAVLAETKEAFVPALSATAGVGKATGAPLEPPVVFSIAAQSLVFSFAQPDYIRAAHKGVDSAQLALEAVRSDVAEDAVTTYVTLDNALRRRAVQGQAYDTARHLLVIVQDRLAAGIDPHVELTKARRTEAQIHLGSLLVEDEISEQEEHLAQLTGLPATGLTTVHDSIPAMDPPSAEPFPTSAAATDAAVQGTLSASFAAAQAKQYTAHGDSRYLFLPQISLSANYSRISTVFTTYDQYYPGYDQPGNSFNSLGIGVQITVPLLDLVRRAKAREAAQDAVHSLLEARLQQDQFLAGRHKLRRSTAELAARTELAGLDRDLAQDQLEAMRLRLQAAAGAVNGEQMTPKDEQNALLDQQQRTLDELNDRLQLEQAEVQLMRQDGSLGRWLGATIPAGPTGAAPAVATPGAASPTPSTSISTSSTETSAPPPTAPTVGTTPAGTPTTGTVPTTLPSGPVTNPAPGNPPTSPASPPQP